MKIIDSFEYLNSLFIMMPSPFMGFLKKLKDTAEKGAEKGTDIGKQGVKKRC